MTAKKRGVLPAGAGGVRCLDCDARAAADGRGNPIVLRHSWDCSQRSATSGLQMTTQWLDQEITNVVKRLRGLADDLDRLRQDIQRVGQDPGFSNYTDIVQQVHHELAWGFANLQAAKLIKHAARAEQARTRLEKEGEDDPGSA